MGKAKTRKAQLPPGVALLTDGRYRVRASATVDGRRVDRTQVCEPGVSLADALLALEALRQELLSPTPATPPVPTVEAYAASWLRRRVDEGVLRVKTLETYAIRLDKTLIPVLGGVRLDELTRADIVRWRDGLQARVGERSGATARSWWRDGLTVLRDGLAEHELRDVTARLRGPAGPAGRRQADTLSAEQVEQLLTAAADEPRRALVRFLARTGCRLGEALALRWCDLDLDARVATIARSVAPIGGGWQTSPPKNGRVRRVGLTPDLVAELEAWRTTMPGVGDALVWRTSGGQPLWHKNVHELLRRCARRAGIELKVGPQILRRTYNTLALAAGVDRVLLQASIGHAGDAMTAHYTGLSATQAAALAAAVWGG